MKHICPFIYAYFVLRTPQGGAITGLHALPPTTPCYQTCYTLYITCGNYCCLCKSFASERSILKTEKQPCVFFSLKHIYRPGELAYITYTMYHYNIYKFDRHNTVYFGGPTETLLIFVLGAQCELIFKINILAPEGSVIINEVRIILHAFLMSFKNKCGNFSDVSLAKPYFNYILITSFFIIWFKDVVSSYIVIFNTKYYLLKTN